MDNFFALGWVKFPYDTAVEKWAAHANEAAKAAEASPPEGMLRCGGTWFVGLEALENDAEGRLPGGPPLAGAAVETAKALMGGPFAFDRAQASVIYPGYPRPDRDESALAYQYRVNLDAAHVDGLHRIMPGRRRMLKEAHGFILGLPLNDPPVGAAPLTVWEGSHMAIRSALMLSLSRFPPEEWPDVDVTVPYQAARRWCFQTLRRVEVAARPGEAYLLHRLTLHGVAPWRGGAEGRRAVAYFRPNPAPDAPFNWWLQAP